MKKEKPEDSKINPQLKDFIKVKKGVDGFGLFALSDISKGQFIIEYFGPILNDEEVQEKGGRYLFQISKNKTVDGSIRENIARYINHSCRPNCEVEIKKGRILVFTKKKVKAGEEFNYDYGKDYFNEYIKPKGCMCLKCKENN